MKKLLMAITSAVLSMTMLVLAPAQVLASTQDDEEDRYISEVKIGMGVTSEQAAKELLDEGYSILKDENGNYADLNKDAGAKSPMKEGPNQKIVYLGFKSTEDVNDAITDLAVMNMKGGYSYEDYEKLMQSHMDTQIKPFVNRFIATLKEYRENLQKPQDSVNFKRANYYKTLLNKLTDDDTGGKPLGDLLVNQTKYEMGDDAYNALSDEEKKNHCDILTLLMQGNGRGVMLMETQLTKSADSSSSTWLDRFKETSLEKLTETVKNENPNMTPSEINAKLDKMYNDDAKKILEKWDAFNEILLNYDNSVKIANAPKENTAKIDKTLDEKLTDEELTKVAVNMYKSESEMVKNGRVAEEIAAHDELAAIKYGDGTMLEFFERDKSEFDDSENIRELYPIVDSLTGGQLAGLDFLSIMDMVMMAVSDENGFKSLNIEKVVPASIYQDVNREIYEKGGVALTDAAIRAKATAQETEKTFELSALGIVLWSCTAAAGLAAAGTMTARSLLTKPIAPELSAETRATFKQWDALKTKADQATMDTFNFLYDNKGIKPSDPGWAEYFKNMNALGDKQKLLTAQKDAFMQSPEYQSMKAELETFDERHAQFEEAERQFIHKSNVCKYLAAGFTILGAVLAGVSIYVTVEEMKAYYKVDFSPIPKYIVDRADITAKNAKGQEIMIKNQTAYYKAALCNRTAGSSDVEKKNYEILKDRNDLNGDVGQQWLSLYSVKYINGAPILANSLKLKMGNGNAPDDYTTGIHRFGETVAFNLTFPKYTYNDPNNGTYVYYQKETSTVNDLKAAGSTFSGGSLTLGIVGGVLAGCALTLILLKVNNKKKKKESATA